MRTKRKSLSVRKYRLFILCGIGLLTACSKVPEIPPRFAYPGYQASLDFTDDFTVPEDHWKKEGDGSINIIDDRLHIELGPESEGLMMWADHELPEDFQIEYEVELPETPGLNTLVLCAQGTDGENVLKMDPPRTGKLPEYSESEIRSYHISYHCYGSDGIHNPGSKIRKNPGHMLLSRVEPDPCMANRRYLIDMLKIGNRLLLYVDEILVHDIRDRGGFGPTYKGGHTGLWIYGNGGVFKTIIDGFRIYELKPV